MVGGISGTISVILGHDETTKNNLEEFKVLILGVSTDIDAELSDTIMVASYNPNTQMASILSIPRDTNTNSNENTTTASDKINSLYNQTKTADETLEAVNEITGLNIENYVVVKTESLIEFVDAIGGVEFDVPIDMDYDSDSQDLHIHLEAGLQVLDGEQAEQLVRFRHNNDGTTYSSDYGDNDDGRMRTQREFIIATIKETISLQNILKINDLIDIIDKSVSTNIDFEKLSDYIPYIIDIDTDTILTGVLPGENVYLEKNGVWVFEYNEEETEELIKELFYDRDLSEDEIDKSIVGKSDLKIEVINSSDNTKTLTEVVEILTDAGYTVTRTDTGTNTSKTTINIETEGIDDFASNIKTILGIGTISTDIDELSKTDITITIGKDY